MRTHVVNFSGGRTSAKLVLEVESLRKRGLWPESVEYVFADTGAEHPKTYEFIRNFVRYSGINLTCLRAKISKELGVGTTYEVIPIESIGYDLQVWRDMLAAYSSPFNPGGGFCTDMLKSIPSDKYCNEKYGKGNYFKWIGYRTDEAKRAWGHEIYSKLINAGLDQQDSLELMVSCLKTDDVKHIASNVICDTADAFDPDKSSKIADLIVKKVGKIKKAGFRFMFEIDDSEKEDVKAFWSKMPFDLEIEEHFGNCVFCIKKDEKRIELAARAEPELASDWAEIFTENTVRDLGRGFPPDVIYRGKLSMQGLRTIFKDVETVDIEQRVRHLKKDGTSSGCSESCSAFSNQLELL